jgi:hypothetical protein
MTDIAVPYDDVLQLLLNVSALIPSERRRDFQNVVGPFLIEHEPDQDAVSLIVFDLLEDQKPRPMPTDATPAQRRDRAARNILRHRDAALSIGIDDLPDGLPEAVARDVSMADAALREWRHGSPDERAQRYHEYRRNFE